MRPLRRSFQPQPIKSLTSNLSVPCKIHSPQTRTTNSLTLVHLCRHPRPIVLVRDDLHNSSHLLPCKAPLQPTLELLHSSRAMSCCLPPRRVLTRAERVAIARLRERRAAGLSPSCTAHSVAAPRSDPLVTFYAAAARSAAPVPPRKPRPKKPPTRKPRQPTAHQLKKEAAALRRVNRNSPRLAPPPPIPSRERRMSGVEKTPKGAIVVIKNPMRMLGRPTHSAEVGSSTMSSSASSGEERPAPFVSAAKAAAVWQKLTRGRGESEDGTGREAEGGVSGVSGSHALKANMRKKWDDVVTRFGGNSANGEKFVMKERPEPSDLGESYNDIYFQKIMTMES